MSYRIVYTKEAEQDLADVLDYIANILLVQKQRKNKPSGLWRQLMGLVKCRDAINYMKMSLGTLKD